MSRGFIVLYKEKLKERLLKYLEEDKRSIPIIAMHIGISYNTLYDFLYGERKTIRKTLIAINQFLQERDRN